MLKQFMDEFDAKIQTRLDALKVQQLEETVKVLQRELADTRMALQKATNEAKEAADAAQTSAKNAQTTADKAISGELKGLNVAGGGKINGQLTIDVSALPDKGGNRRNALRLITHPGETSAVIIAHHNQSIEFWNGGAGNTMIDVVARKFRT